MKRALRCEDVARWLLNIAVLCWSVSLVATGCSNSAEPDPGPPPVDTIVPDPPPVVPLDGRGGGILAYTLQPGPDGSVHVIYAMNADGSGSTRISNASIGVNHHEWSPDAFQIATVGYYDGNETWSIHVFDSDGTDLERLTHTAGVWDTEPTWSPDGARIAFTRIFPSQNDRTELWLMNSDGSDQHWIGVEGFAARWSADGSRFLYASDYQGDSDILTCNIDGTDVQSVLATSAAESTPVWSPDGEEIVFGSDSDGDQEIYVMNADGSNIRQLTTNSVADFTPRWSSDGSLIAFDSGELGENNWEIFVINADGTNLRQITDTPEPMTSINPVWRPTFLGEERPFATAIPFAATIPGTDFLHGSLTFSPNSEEVVWSSFLENGTGEKLFFSTFDGVSLSAPESLPGQDSFDNHGPAFSHDGSRLFFSSFRPYPNADSDSLHGVWYVDRSGDGWNGPVPVVVTLDSLRTVGQVSIADNGNLYFSGRLVHEAEPRLYRSEFVGGVYENPQPLSGAMNNEGTLDPFIDPEERFILFAVYQRNDSHGLIDLYISHRLDDGSFGAPINLGERVNSEHFERFPSISRDGKYLFFVRSLEEQFVGELADFYWIGVREVAALRN